MKKIFKFLISLACCLPLTLLQNANSINFIGSPNKYYFRSNHACYGYFSSYFQISKNQYGNYKISYLPDDIYIDPRNNKEITFDTFCYLVSQHSIINVSERTKRQHTPSPYPIEHKKSTLFGHTRSNIACIKNNENKTALVLNLKTNTITIKNLSNNTIHYLGELQINGDKFSIIDTMGYEVCPETTVPKSEEPWKVYLTSAFITFAPYFENDQYLLTLNRSQSCVKDTLYNKKYEVNHTRNYTRSDLTTIPRRNTI